MIRYTRRVRFRPSRTGLAACAVGPELKVAVRDVAATKAKPFAIAISPRSRKQHRHYADSFDVEDTLDDRLGHPDRIRVRVAARLVNTVGHATAVEVGATVEVRGRTYEIPGHWVLRRTLEYLHATSGQL